MESHSEHRPKLQLYEHCFEESWEYARLTAVLFVLGARSEWSYALLGEGIQKV